MTGDASLVLSRTVEMAGQWGTDDTGVVKKASGDRFL